MDNTIYRNNDESQVNGINIIKYKGETYPDFQSKGFAAKFAFPFAQQVCVGYGFDIGCNRPEWAYVDRNGMSATMIDPVLDSRYDAMHLPSGKMADYIFSSHCLEHIDNWVTALEYWHSKLKTGGVLCLYLPDYSQKYWRPWNNRKHVHYFTPNVIKDYLTELPEVNEVVYAPKWVNVFVSGVDLNNSFMVIAQKG